MVAEGKLDWDTTPVSKYLPEFELKDPTLTSQLTFVDLLSHRLVMRSESKPYFKKKKKKSLIRGKAALQGILIIQIFHSLTILP